MSVSFKTDGVEISALRDRAMFNTFAGNSSYVIKDIGDELEVTYSSNSFVVTLGTGEAVICGGSMLSEGILDALTLGANESGYLVVEVDMSQSGSNICQFKNVPVLTQENINSSEGFVYDLPLYQYSTTSSGVQNMVDVRLIKDAATGDIYFTSEGDKVFANFKNGDQQVKKELGSIVPSTLTATRDDVLSGKTFGGAGSDEMQTGSMENNGTRYATLTPSAPTYSIPRGYHDGGGKVSILTETKSVTPTASVQNVTPSTNKVLSKVTVNAVPTETKTVTPSTSAQDVTPSANKFLSKVTVNAVATETKSVNPSTEAVVVTPSANKYLSKVTVNPISSKTNTYSANGSNTGGQSSGTLNCTLSISSTATYVEWLAVSVAGVDGRDGIGTITVKADGTTLTEVKETHYGTSDALRLYRVMKKVKSFTASVTHGGSASSSWRSIEMIAIK